MISSKSAAIAAAALATSATIGLWAASSMAQNAAGPFNAPQVTAGQSAFVASCAACHGATMAGSGEAPALAGRIFMTAFGGKTTKELFDIIKTEMPQDAPGSLSDQTYTNLVAFMLHANGAKTGTTALTPATAVKISSVANGTIAPEVTAGLKGVEVAQAAPAAPATGGAAQPAGRRPPPIQGFGAGAAEAQRLAQPRCAAGCDAERQDAGRINGLGLIKEGNIANYRPVTDAMLANPSPNDWLITRGNYAGWSYSPLGQINTSNVGQLQMQWSLAMNDGGPNEASPLVHDGIMFLRSANSTVQAINAVTGEVLWQNNLGPVVSTQTTLPGGDSDATRAIAIYNDKVIVPTADFKLYALDAKTGKIVWQTLIDDQAKPNSRGSQGGVLVAHGKAITGMTDCVPRAEHCYISAYDANTGKRVWKFVTIADKGQPGGDTWGDLPNDQRSGSGTWIVGTYDPVLNTTYWGTSQAKPWRRDLRGTGDGATDYANSTLALDADTGKLKWWFNHAPGESFDLDEVFERLLIDHGDQKTVMTVGKPGIIWKLDRVTGKYLDSRQTVFQNVFVKIDPKTGRPTYRKDIIDQKVDQWIPTCPGPEGGKDWPMMSYHQPDDTLIIPLSQSCVTMLGSGAEQFYEMPGSDGNMGRLSAYRTSNLQPVWSLQQRAPFNTGVVSTAGNVAFVGDFDRVVHAFDTRTGKQVWKTRLTTSVQGGIASYAVNGKQYIAVMTGLGGGSPEEKPSFLLGQEVTRPLHGTAIFIFSLPDNNQQASN